MLRSEQDGQIIVCSKNRVISLRAEDFQMTGNKEINDPITCGLIVGDLLVLGSYDRQNVYILDRLSLVEIIVLSV